MPIQAQNTAPKRVLCIMDLSVAGRAGLGVVAPVLSACGVQACALPSALFSTHTGGFGAVEKRDEAEFGRAALAHFAREEMRFDAIYIGYLYGDAQFALADAAIVQYPGAFVVVDPALGDEGKLYSGLTEAAVARMRALCQKAGLVTPNYTECALLCGEQPTAAPPAAGVLREQMQALLVKNARRHLLVTSVPQPDGRFATAGHDGGSGGGEAYFDIVSDHLPCRYPGTGDSLCAATLGLLLGGAPLPAAAQKATDFVGAAVRHTYEGGGPPREGLWFERFLPLLGK